MLEPKQPTDESEIGGPDAFGQFIDERESWSQRTGLGRLARSDDSPLCRFSISK